MSRSYIYSLECPEARMPIYIGQTIRRPEDRYKEHVRNKKYDVGKWIDSLSKKGLLPDLKIIDEVPLEESSFWERHYIDLYKSWGFNLKNTAKGGAGCLVLGKKRSEETKQKISIAHSGDNHYFRNGSKNPEHLAVLKQRTGDRGRRFFLENNPNNIPEVRQKNSLSKLGDKNPAKRPEVRKLISERLRLLKGRRPVLQFDKNMNFIKEWDKMLDAARSFGKKKGDGIYGVCIGRRPTAHGFVWRYKDEIIKS